MYIHTHSTVSQTTTTTRLRQVGDRFVVRVLHLFMAESSERPSGGVARRRRERRMRSWFRHEQQSIRTAMATVLHHSYDRVHTEYGAPRSQTTATRTRERRESNGTKYTAKIRKTPPSQAFFQLYDEEGAERGMRPGSVLDLVPQGRVQQRTVEHRIGACPFVQILDAPVPLMGDQVLELLQKIVSSLVEPVQVLAFAIIATKAGGGGEQRHWPSSSLPLQFLRVGREVVEVFMILEQDRVLQLRL